MWCDILFNDTATTEIYTLSLHDALPIFVARNRALDEQQPADRIGADDFQVLLGAIARTHVARHLLVLDQDRKSTRLNSSHANISYAVFCLKKKTSIILTLHYLPRIHHLT